ncbi:MAG TPA: hypothetical protein VG164_03415 [Trebonia sp.]|nr:hypothetical protein [Trebonia sp.]
MTRMLAGPGTAPTRRVPHLVAGQAAVVRRASPIAVPATASRRTGRPALIPGRPTAASAGTGAGSPIAARAGLTATDPSGAGLTGAGPAGRWRTDPVPTGREPTGVRSTAEGRTGADPAGAGRTHAGRTHADPRGADRAHAGPKGASAFRVTLAVRNQRACARDRCCAGSARSAHGARCSGPSAP